MQECSQVASHNEGQLDESTRPKQLRNREVPWEGSHGSKLMSRRTERPYKVDGTGRLAPHSEARCSVPEINGPVVQQEFTSLLRETCGPSLSATAGAVVSNDHRAGQESAEAVGPRATSRENRKVSPLRKGRTWQAEHDHRWSCSRSVDAERLSFGQRPPWQRKSGCSIRQDCQEPPDADPHVRWCGSPEGKPSGRPDCAPDMGVN